MLEFLPQEPAVVLDELDGCVDPMGHPGGKHADGFHLGVPQLDLHFVLGLLSLLVFRSLTS